MTRVRIYLVSGPKADGEFIFESIHTTYTSGGVPLRRAYDIIRRHLANADVGRLFNWELSVVGR